MKTINTLSLLWVLIILIAGVRLSKGQDAQLDWCEHLAVMEASRSPQVVVLTHQLNTGTPEQKAQASRTLNALYEAARMRGRIEAAERARLRDEENKARVIEQHLQMEYIRALQMNR